MASAAVHMEAQFQKDLEVVCNCPTFRNIAAEKPHNIGQTKFASQARPL